MSLANKVCALVFLQLYADIHNKSNENLALCGSAQLSHHVTEQIDVILITHSSMVKFVQASQSSDGPKVITTQGDLERAIEYMHSLLNGTVHGGVLLEKVAGPKSSGYLHLATLDPNDNPSVRFNYFQDPEDLEKCVMGMKTILQVIESEPFQQFRVPGMSVQSLINIVVNFPLNLRPRHFDTALSLEQFCIDTVLTIWHYHGGCQVNKVVDRDYKVLGTLSLRVIDGSTFYDSPGTNPQATVMMLGRYIY